MTVLRFQRKSSSSPKQILSSTRLNSAKPILCLAIATMVISADSPTIARNLLSCQWVKHFERRNAKAIGLTAVVLMVGGANLVMQILPGKILPVWWAWRLGLLLRTITLGHQNFWRCSVDWLFIPFIVDAKKNLNNSILQNPNWQI